MMWRQYDKDIKALPAPERLSDKQVPSSLPAIANIAYHDNNKVRDLEGRVKLSEQSNRVLLEELMKLQQDLKVAFRQNEEMVLNERQERIAIKEKVEAAENMYTKLSMQLLRTEEKVNMEHTTLASLLNQSKEVERALAGGQQRSLMKGEQIDQYISRFREELVELRQMNEQIYSNMRLVADDVKTLKHRYEMQNSEYGSAAQEMKQKIKRVEIDSMAAMENILRRQESRDSLESNTSHLKQSIELRLSELRDAMNEMRRKVDVEASERRAADQQAQLNVDKVQVSLRELETKYQEVCHAANMTMREKNSEHEAEKSKVMYKMAELSEEQHKKALQREMQLREEAQMKFSILEKKLQEEQSSRLAFEKSVRYEMENILKSLKLHLSEEVQNMREKTKLSQVHGDQSLARMSECVTLLEGEIEAGKKAFEEVLHAEIISRQTQNEKTVDQCKELQEKLSVAVVTLQQAITGVTTQTLDAVEQVRKDTLLLLDESGESGVNGLADIDSRLANLRKHMTDIEEKLQDQANVEVTTDNGDYERLRERVDRSSQWQEEAEKTLSELSIEMQPLNGEISRIKKAIEELRVDIEDERIERAGERSEQEETPTNNNTAPRDTNLEKKVKVMENELTQVSSQLEKLDNTVNTLRTVLSQKISSEAKTVEQLKEVFTADVEKLVNYFMREQRRVFVKHRHMDAKVYRPDIEKNGAKEAHNLHLALLGINRWGVYEAYKMLKLKAIWFQVVEKKKKAPEASDNYINYEQEDGKGKEIEEEKDSEKEESENEKEESEEEKESEEEEEEESEEESEEEEQEESDKEESEKEESEKEESEKEESEKDESEKDESETDESDKEKGKKEKKPGKKPEAKPGKANESRPSNKNTSKKK